MSHPKKKTQILGAHNNAQMNNKNISPQEGKTKAHSIKESNPRIREEKIAAIHSYFICYRDED